ncbi:uncharacterized protein DUF4286 [Dyadobacter jejuensis]|uniref:Uncharacterized protein DUF4286 n=1 Tax=Dyadobacter jejuensis TaxID=1082580 RepID=A0A316AJW2_9BACT|nr:DUF4286 family protein [Dyadobacter jejuensis]PWJ57539.1 uncharacterized protein DUF4286 [Dyadobacter jejuensis]
MIIYNITVNVNLPAEKQWLDYMKTTYLPAIHATGLPAECKLLRLLTEIENEGVTYTTQFRFHSMEDFLAYQTEFQPALADAHHQKFNGHYVSFKTLLEEA